jgi:hypothetical protein
MIGLFCFVLAVLASPFKSKLRLEAENAVLRHQLIILRRRLHGRVRLTNHDRWFFIQLYRWFPAILKVLTIVRPETLVRWHRAGFRRYWRWNSRRRGGRPPVEMELRALIRRMSIENPLWGAPRIHGELLKLGFEVAQSSVAKYIVECHLAKDGAPFCVIMLQTLPPWTCSLSRPLASICFMRSSSCGWIVEISFGLTSQPTRRRSGLHVRSPRLFLGTWPRVT